MLIAQLMNSERNINEHIISDERFTAEEDKLRLVLREVDTGPLKLLDEEMQGLLSCLLGHIMRRHETASGGRVLSDEAILTSQVAALAQNEVTQTNAGTRMHRLDLRQDLIALMLACRDDLAPPELFEVGFVAKPFL